MNTTNPSLVNKGVSLKPLTLDTPWKLLSEDLSLPVAVISEQALNNNIRWMQSFADKSKVLLAPHGKTTMIPAIFSRQVAAGAWGISLATVAQVQAAAEKGIKRILMANQLVGKHNMAVIAALIKQYDLTFYCLVDNIDNVQTLAHEFERHQCDLNVLIEIGVEGGRCGCRNLQQVLALAHQLARYKNLILSGVEVYEGVISGTDAENKIRKFLQFVGQTVQSLFELRLFDADLPIVTGAGSAWYDVVAEELTIISNLLPITPIIRPGCYVAFDTGIYQHAQQKVIERSHVAASIEGSLQSALSVWGYVQSVPEPGKVIVGIGKRDIAFDAGMPKPENFYRINSASPKIASIEWQVVNVMDQHLFLQVPTEADIQVGDMLSFSCSHPCLTFDKWRYVGLINQDYHVTELFDCYF